MRLDIGHAFVLSLASKQHQTIVRRETPVALSARGPRLPIVLQGHQYHSTKSPNSKRAIVKGMNVVSASRPTAILAGVRIESLASQGMIRYEEVYSQGDELALEKES